MTVALDEMVAVTGIPTLVRRVGQGPAVVVVHGGPGFSHDYLEPTLARLAERRTLILYDQPGSGRSPVPGAVSAGMIFRHFASLVDDTLRYGRLGILAHSWGALVALGAAAAGMRRPAFDEGLLVTPVPTNRAAYDAASGNLFGRIPADVRARYGDLAAKHASAEIVDLLLPYYLARPMAPRKIGLEIDIATFTSVTVSLGDFDFAAGIGLFEHCAAVTTDRDFSTPDLLRELLHGVARRFTLPEVGHFPGHEAPTAFGEILNQVFLAAG